MASLREKVFVVAEYAAPLVREWQDSGKRLVFTNGCFDLLHVGHVLYLEEARALGDVLIVGLNSDASVSRLKGPNRPIQDEYSRAHVLAALESVAMVVLFSEDDPYELIRLLQPDVLVKGGDWKADQIVGSDLVLKNGGEVKSLSFMEGHSTTQIEQKIQNRG
jgi:rfaE bifunctional protein nucleotidyltransferase chain/domain